LKPQNEFEYYAHLVALYETNNFLSLISDFETYEDLLNEHLFESKIFYFEALLATELYEKLIEITSFELENPSNSSIYNENLISFYNKAFDKINNINEDEEIISEEELLELLRSPFNDERFTLVVKQLRQREIINYLKYIKPILENKDFNKVFKVMLLDLLSLQEVDIPFKVIEPSKEYYVNPKTMGEPFNAEVNEAIITLINKNVPEFDEKFATLAENVLQYVLINNFPEKLKKEEIKGYAMAISFTVAQSLELSEESIEDIVNSFNLSENEIHRYLDKISDIISQEK
ncbi:MAG: hypothetical protein LBM99_06560, partial [Bacillales bacterium]|nr:hypothetical protein [Bacillales bacterium]